jgi:DNA-directed RNA polymerase subunit RPC12/RpoP
MVKYECDDCKEISDINIDQPIRCKHCGGRTLNKVRGTGVIQYVAR